MRRSIRYRSLMTVALVPFSLIYFMHFAAGEADGNKCTYEVTEVRAIDVVALSVPPS